MAPRGSEKKEKEKKGKKAEQDGGDRAPAKPAHMVPLEDTDNEDESDSYETVSVELEPRPVVDLKGRASASTAAPQPEQPPASEHDQLRKREREKPRKSEREKCRGGEGAGGEKTRGDRDERGCERQERDREKPREERDREKPRKKRGREKPREERGRSREKRAAEETRDLRKPAEPRGPPPSHSVSEGFTCQHCGRSFRHKAGLEQHQYWSQKCCATSLYNASPNKGAKAWEKAQKAASQVQSHRAKGWWQETYDPAAQTWPEKPRGQRQPQAKKPKAAKKEKKKARVETSSPSPPARKLPKHRRRRSSTSSSPDKSARRSRRNGRVHVDVIRGRIAGRLRASSAACALLLRAGACWPKALPQGWRASARGCCGGAAE